MNLKGSALITLKNQASSSIIWHRLFSDSTFKCPNTNLKITRFSRRYPVSLRLNLTTTQFSLWKVSAGSAAGYVMGVGYCKRGLSTTTSITTVLRAKAKAVAPKVILEHHSPFFFPSEESAYWFCQQSIDFSPLSLPLELGKGTTAECGEQNPRVIDCNTLFCFDRSFWVFQIKSSRCRTLTWLMLSIGFLGGSGIFWPLVGKFPKTNRGRNFTVRILGDISFHPITQVFS